MRRNRILLGGVAIVAAGVLAYFAFFHTTPTSENALGTIGTVDKYRANQISDEDVVLDQPGRTSGDAGAVVLDPTELLGRASAQEKAEFLASATEEELVAMLGRADTELKARLFDNYLSETEQLAVLALARQGGMDQSGRSFAKDAPMDQSGVSFEREGSMDQSGRSFDKDAPMDQSGVSFEREGSMDQSGRSFDKDAPMDQSGVSFEREGSMDQSGRSFQKDAPMDQSGVSFERMGSQDQSGRGFEGITLTVQEAATLFERASFDKQRAALMNNVSPALQSSILQRADTRQLAGMFERASVQQYQDVLGRITQFELSALLGRTSVENQAKLLSQASPQEFEGMFERSFAGSY
jgi:hypothetical protein